MNSALLFLVTILIVAMAVPALFVFLKNRFAGSGGMKRRLVIKSYKRPSFNSYDAQGSVASLSFLDTSYSTINTSYMGAPLRYSKFVAFTIAGLFFITNIIAQTSPATYNNPNNNGQSANTFTAPAGVFSVTVEVWGAGGAGGGATGTNNRVGGGGGGGAYRKTTDVPVTPGSTYTITVGSGGVPSPTFGNGGNGGASSATFNSGITVSANGGSGGTGATTTNGTGGAGATGGTFNGGDGFGFGGTGNQMLGGGGGSSAGTGSNGIDATSSTGATAVQGGGKGGSGVNGNVGEAGGNPGGGGAGSVRSSNTNRIGGAGGNGQVVISWTACPTITATLTAAAVKCLGTSNGSIIVNTPTGGSGSYEYSINGTWQASPTFNGLAAGTYQIAIRDANATACVTDLDGTTGTQITEPALVVASGTKVNVLCNGASTGSIDLSVVGGSGSYTYLWSNGATTQDISGLAAGTYTVTITESNGCTVTGTQSFTITEPALVVVSSAVKKSYNGADLSCATATDGEITVTGAGGTGTLKYSKDNGANYVVSNVFSGLAAGTYQIRVKDANGCQSASIAVTITAPVTITGSGAVTSNYNGAQISCVGSTDGKITVTASGGTGTLSYSINGGAYVASNVFTGLGAGTHTLSVKDANGCTFAPASVTITAPPVLNVSASYNNPVYVGAPLNLNGTVSGGTGAHTINWTSTTGYTSSGVEDPNVTLTATLADAGTYTLQVTDANSCTKNANVVVAISKRSTQLLYTGASNVQYSDPVNLSATLTDNSGASPAVSLAGRTIKFTIGTQSVTAVTNTSGVASTSMIVTQGPGVYTVATEFNGSLDAAFNSSNDSDPFTINKEDAIIVYSGDIIKAATTASSTSVSFDLRAAIFDVSYPQNPANADYDAYAGDIRNAKVRFVNADNESGITINSNWQNVSDLVAAPDTRVGSVAIPGGLTINGLSSTNSSRQIRIGIEVNNNGYYYALDDIIITAYLPTGDFITGGGYIVPTKSVGTMKAALGTKTNFGFNVKFNKKGTNLQGNMNFVFRSVSPIDNKVHTYQAKANAMESLGVNATNPASQTANFLSKCNITDITNPLAPVPVGGGKFMFVNMVDNGEPGVNDLISFVIVESNGNTPKDPTVLANILYSSHWEGSLTQMIKLGGGNLVVKSGFNLGSASTAPSARTAQPAVAPAEPAAAQFNITTYPNPAPTHFNVKLESADLKEKITLRVYDMQGRVVETRTGLSAGQTLRLGSEYKQGVYILEMIQGTARKQARVIKQAN